MLDHHAAQLSSDDDDDHHHHHHHYALRDFFGPCGPFRSPYNNPEVCSVMMITFYTKFDGLKEGA
jgi:hypothetical protein